MKIEVKDIPQEIIDLLDSAAGKKHSKEGIVLRTLAEVLTKWEELKTNGSSVHP